MAAPLDGATANAAMANNADQQQAPILLGPAGMYVEDWADLVTIEVGPARNAFLMHRFLAKETSRVLQRRLAHP